MEEKNNDPFRTIDVTGNGESHLIEDMEKRLYSRQVEIPHKGRTILHPKKISAHGKEAWEEGEGPLGAHKWEEKDAGSPFVKFFLFSLVFFLVATGIAGYGLFSKKIVVSPNNVGVTLFGPVSTKGGEELAIQVLIENKNTVPLNGVQLTTNFPAGSRHVSNSAQEQVRVVKKLESIDAGETRTEIVKAIVLGGKNEKKEIAFEIRFSIEGSDALYTKTKKFVVNLTDSPLSFTTTLLQEITPGQDFTLGVDVKANSSVALKNTILKIDYPQGFIFKGAVPSPVKGDNLWSLGEMKLGDTVHIEIQGSILGESEQQKIFRISAGVGTEQDALSLKTLLSFSQAGVTIKKSFLGIEIFLGGGNFGTTALEEGKSSNISIQWTNNLLNKVNDVELAVSLSGNVINKKSVLPNSEGLYNAINNIITWDKRVVKDLASLSPGEKGSVSFAFSLIPYSVTNAFKNPTITITTNVKGKRIDENNVPEDVKFLSTKTIKVNTTTKVSSYGTYYGDPIPNTGPLPPKVGEETTYTVTWEAKNSSNDINGAQVFATIPLSVRWTGKVFPNGSPVSYDSTSKKVTWKIGNLKSGTGYLEDPAKISFQVALLPGLSQLYRSPMILSETTMTAVDSFTGTHVSSVAEFLSTIISRTDPKATQEDGMVTE
jgi:hypothetical protein